MFKLMDKKNVSKFMLICFALLDLSFIPCLRDICLPWSRFLWKSISTTGSDGVEFLLSSSDCCRKSTIYIVVSINIQQGAQW